MLFRSARFHLQWSTHTSTENELTIDLALAYEEDRQYGSKGYHLCPDLWLEIEVGDDSKDTWGSFLYDDEKFLNSSGAEKYSYAIDAKYRRYNNLNVNRYFKNPAKYEKDAFFVTFLEQRETNTYAS